MKIVLQLAGKLSLLLFLFACSNPQQPVSTPEKTVDTTTKGTTEKTISPSQNEHTHIVEISRMQFNPAEITISSGDTVIWINNDLTNHCVTEVNKSWTSSSMEPGKSFKKAIITSTDYFCAIHVVMKGKIIVQ